MQGRRVALLAALVVFVAACAGFDDAGDGGTGEDRPTIVSTTGILADVVGELVGTVADVDAVLPAAADPHSFQPSARDVLRIQEADVLVANGGGFEAGLVDVIDGAARDGVPVCVALDTVSPLPAATTDETADPHFFTDPSRMAEAARGLLECIAAAQADLVDVEVRREADDYIASLDQLDLEVEALLAPIPPERRALVTNHDAFSYFADRYDLEIVATVIPGTTTTDLPSAEELARVSDVLAELEVRAIFIETSASSDVAESIASDLGGVEIVPLHTGSLGEDQSGPQTYLEYVRANASAIADALG